MSRYLSEEKKWSIVSLTKYAGWSPQHIASEVELSNSNVTKILLKYNQYGTVENKFSNCGRKPVKVNHEVINEIISSIEETSVGKSGGSNVL